MVCSIKEVFERKPEWVKRQISQREGAIMSRHIMSSGATVGAEIGVASGFSSAVLFSALTINTDKPRLHSFDLAHDCYFDTSRRTGQAFGEIHGAVEGWTLTTRVTSLDVTEVEPLDFIFIDANHATPWPAFDLLSLGRFLKPDGWIALDDVEMTFVPKWQTGGKNGARDLFRAWRGEKLRYEGATSMALLKATAPETMVRSIADSLMLDWDEAISDEDVEKIKKITAFYGPVGERVDTVVQRRRNSYKKWQPVKPKPGFLGLPEAKWV